MIACIKGESTREVGLGPAIYMAGAVCYLFLLLLAISANVRGRRATIFAHCACAMSFQAVPRGCKNISGPKAHSKRPHTHEERGGSTQT
jgi:hypothetical protein